jgi:hypothetical protein
MFGLQFGSKESQGTAPVKSLEERKAEREAKQAEADEARRQHGQWKRLELPTRAVPPLQVDDDLRPKLIDHDPDRPTRPPGMPSRAIIDALAHKVDEHRSAAPTTSSTDPEERNPIYAYIRQARKRIEDETKRWNPDADLHITGDPKCTIIVARMTPTTTEEDLRAHFSRYGKVLDNGVRIVRQRNPATDGSAPEGGGRSKGYGFVCFKFPDEAKAAVKSGNGTVLNGKEILVDFERARRQPKFRPQRLRPLGWRDDEKWASSEADAASRTQASKRPRTD